jgi:membrane protease YdiL (CAAX protease family)
MIFAFPLLWALGTVAGYFYAVERGIPWPTALAVLPSFLIEITFYFVLGVDRLRSRIEKLNTGSLAALLTASAVAPYCVATLTVHSFDWRALAILTGLAGIAAFWYVILPSRPAADILFLIFIAVVYLLKPFASLYPDPHPRLQLDILGQLMWFRTGLFAMVSVRRTPDIGFGFWPSPREWKIGAVYFVMLLPVVAVLAWALGFTQVHVRYPNPSKLTLMTVATFFGVLWVIALGEEFFFRGLLQQWIAAWTRNDWVGIITTALIFGSVHIWYRPFPNWKFAALAAVAGLFYGLAFRRAKSIRASMVTHALTVTTWRMFFS